MNGIQYYLKQDVPLNKGHIIFIDSPWAVTAISQIQFWNGFDLSKYGNGEARGILSVDVSDWFTKGFNGKTAEECSLAEIIDEVWEQMERSLNFNGSKLIDRSMIVGTHVDCDIYEKTKSLGNYFCSEHNAEPLLVMAREQVLQHPDAEVVNKAKELAAQGRGPGIPHRVS